MVDLYASYLGIKNEIDEAIASVIKESAFIRGSHVEKFEESYAKLLTIKHCVSCANGTDAIYIAMKGLGIKPGDEVITTAHSWISTSETITQAGGKVVFCDTTPDTYTIDPVHIASRITSKTVGIVPVHLFGHPADMDPILDLAKKHNLWVIEDCAQAHLARYKGLLVGTMGNAATFSFYPGKNLGAMGDAGCIVTNDSRLAEWCSLYARHGGKGEHVIEGINSRMDGMQAAILNVKLAYLKDWTKKRQEIANVYEKQLKNVNGITLPIVQNGCEHVFHLYVIKIEERDQLREFLAANGISSIVNYPKALPFYPAYAYLDSKPGDYANAYSNQGRILSLPMYPEMTSSQIGRVSDLICKFELV